MGRVADDLARERVADRAPTFNRHQKLIRVVCMTENGWRGARAPVAEGVGLLPDAADLVGLRVVDHLDHTTARRDVHGAATTPQRLDGIGVGVPVVVHVGTGAQGHKIVAHDAQAGLIHSVGWPHDEYRNLTDGMDGY